MAELDKPIGRDPVSRVRMAVVAQGRPARTDVWPLHQQGGYTALCCRLHTGRTHQIRVHLSHAGHPLVGDVLYGGTPALGMGRQALHARRLAFLHPVSGQALNFEAELPADLAQAWSQISGQAVGATGWAQGLAVPEDAEST
jgi:23S rRNA pseudouridine1911/1915/1917 synthase